MKHTFMVLVLAAIVGTTAITSATAAEPSATTPAAAPSQSPLLMPLTGKDAGALPPGHPPAIPADTKLTRSGKVLQVLDSPTYTYLQVTADKGPLWLAAYKTTVTKGATVKYSEGVAMPKFHSKSLDRTFDMIVFVDTLVLVKK